MSITTNQRPTVCQSETTHKFTTFVVDSKLQPCSKRPSLLSLLYLLSVSARHFERSDPDCCKTEYSLIRCSATRHSIGSVHGRRNTFVCAMTRFPVLSMAHASLRAINRIRRPGEVSQLSLAMKSFTLLRPTHSHLPFGLQTFGQNRVSRNRNSTYVHIRCLIVSSG
jgi:hypothetical protein